MNLPIPNRRAAGRTLAAFLESYQDQGNVLVLALSKDAVPVAYEIATGLGAGLDLYLVRELACPDNDGVSLGAVVSGNIPVLNDGMLQEYPIGKPRLGEETRRQQQVLDTQEQALRGDRSRPELKGRCVILVDDCLEHGGMVRAAARVLRDQDVARLLIAVPVAPTRVMDELQAISDEIAYIATQEPFLGIDWWYEDARPVPEDEARELLGRIPPDSWTSSLGVAGSGSHLPLPGSPAL